MQPRLARSNTEVMLAGICGGLGEYFNIDPVIVRLIFVLVTLTSGLGLPVYIVLWFIMPRKAIVSGQPTIPYQQRSQHIEQDPFAAAQPIGQESGRVESEIFMAQAAQQTQQSASSAAAPPFTQPTQSPPEYRFDPVTGQPLPPNQPATGQTVNLRIDDPDAFLQQPAPVNTAQPPYQNQTPPRRVRNWRTLGYILIGVGGLIVLEQIGLNMSFVFPVLLIVAGVILMRRKR